MLELTPRGLAPFSFVLVPCNLALTLMTALRRHHGVNAREEVDYLDAELALHRLNDTQVARG